jgi:2TM domain-containing protein
MAHTDQAFGEPITASPDVPVLTEAERRERAIRRVAAIKGFYVHFAVYVVVNIGLFVVDLLAGSDWWVQWVAFGWGIGVVAHAVAVFGRGSKFVADWEDRKIKQLMAEQR